MRGGVGTVLVRELRVAARRVPTYQCRVVTVLLVGLLAMGVLLAIGFPHVVFGTGGEQEWTSPARNVRRGIWAAFAAAFGMIVLMSVGLAVIVASRSVAVEREKGTLSKLLTTRLNSFEIVAGKLASSWLRCGAWLIGFAPVFVLFERLGGVDAWLIGLAWVAVASTTFAYVALAVAVSVESRGAKVAAGVAALLAVAWIELPFFASLLGPRWLPVSVYTPLLSGNKILLQSSPLGVFGTLMAAGMPRGGVAGPVLRMAAYQGIAGLLFATWAVARLRPASRALDGGDGGPVAGRGLWFRNRRTAPRRNRPPCGDDPMMWKERYVNRGGTAVRVLAWVVFLGLYGMVAYVTYFLSYGALTEWASEGYSTLRVGEARWHFNQTFVRPISGVAVFMLTAVLAGLTSESLQIEQGKQTWTVLLTTPLSGREILRAKQAAAIRRLLPLMAWVPLVWVYALLIGSIHPLGFLAGLAMLGASAYAAAAFGAHAAVLGAGEPGKRNANSAMLVRLMALFLAPAACYLTGRAEAVVLSLASPPFATITALMTWDEVRSVFSPAQEKFGGVTTMGVEGDRLNPHGARWLLATALLGPAIMVLAGRRFERAAAKGFDAAVGRPTRPGTMVRMPGRKIRPASDRVNE